MAKKIIRGISLILIPVILATSFLVWYDSYLDTQINTCYNSALGRTYGIDEMNKGIKLLEHNANKDDLILLGSSELNADVPENPRNMFPNKELNCDVDLVGRASVQCLLNAVKAGALSESFKDKKIVLVVSLQWFLSEEIDKTAYKSHFSEIQFYKLMKNDTISKDIKKYVCERTVNLAAGESSLERPYLYAYLYQKDNFVSKAILNSLKPYYFIREKFLDLKDKYQASKAVKNFQNNPAQECLDINWESETEKAQKLGEKACTNNKFCVRDDYYTTYLESRIEQQKDSSSNVDLLKSKELDDYIMLLKTFREAGIKPYIVFMPTNGIYYDYVGITQEKRNRFYDKLGNFADEYDIDYLDLRDKEYEPYFMKDVMHLGWKGWLYVNKEITEHYSKGL